MGLVEKEVTQTKKVMVSICDDCRKQIDTHWACNGCDAFFCDDCKSKNLVSRGSEQEWPFYCKHCMAKAETILDQIDRNEKERESLYKKLFDTCRRAKP